MISETLALFFAQVAVQQIGYCWHRERARVSGMMPALLPLGM